MFWLSLVQSGYLSNLIWSVYLGPVWLGTGYFGLVWSGLVWSVHLGLVLFQSVKLGLVWF